jgi:glyoxylase-like metal-dependent hydrolase (beta-lactamase superfamily II)
MQGRAGLRRSGLAAVFGVLAVLSAAALAADAAPIRVARNIFVFPGNSVAPGPDNRGRIANVGVIIGAAGVIVIGTGTSDADGERLLAAIGRLSKRPVVLAINTYAGPEHVLGNSAFARRGIPIMGHRATDDYMVVNCERCQRNLQAIIGDAAMRGTHPERPRRLIDGPVSIEVGGRRLDILHYGPTQQPGSIAVFDVGSGVLFAGALASFDVIPDAHDADLGNWIAALQQLRRLPAKLVVPARGPLGTPDRLDEVKDYLSKLALETQRAYAAGFSLATTTAMVDLPGYRGWAMYAETHRRNVHFQYLKLEARELAGQSTVSQ